jgi:DNA repair exonuclease SbcCD nuclease subunit
MVVRIAHISDTHLGARPRDGVKQNVWGVEMRARLLENDFYERFSEIFEMIANLDPPVELVVHSGDLYDSPWEGNPTQPPVMAQNTAISVMKRFTEETGIPILIIEGNHGLYRLLEVSLLESLKMAIPNLQVATQQDLKRALSDSEPLVFEFENVDVYCYPFIDYAVLESAKMIGDFNDWILNSQKPKSSRTSIAVAHGMDIDKSLFSPIFDLDYDYVALGHDHHQHKYNKNSWYAGSPERWRFDEINHEKGFLVIDVKHGELPEVSPHHLIFTRPVFNESIQIEADDTVESVVDRIESWMKNKGLISVFEPTTAARIRFVIQGSSQRVSPLDLRLALEAFRMRALAQESDYNISQLTWMMKQTQQDFESQAYPEIESEYLIEDPESDFREYLSELKTDESLDESLLTRIAVKSLAISIGEEGKMTLESLLEEESE